MKHGFYNSFSGKLVGNSRKFRKIPSISGIPGAFLSHIRIAFDSIRFDSTPPIRFVRFRFDVYTRISMSTAIQCRISMSISIRCGISISISIRCGISISISIRFGISIVNYYSSLRRLMSTSTSSGRISSACY